MEIMKCDYLVLKYEKVSKGFCNCSRNAKVELKFEWKRGENETTTIKRYLCLNHFKIVKNQLELDKTKKIKSTKKLNND